MDLELDQLRALDAAVTEGSLDGAARVLRVTPSAVSQRLKALESRVGQVLLVRSRPVRTTGAGQVVLRLARQVSLLAADADAELAGVGVQAGPGPAGAAGPSLPVAVNADSLGTWVLPAVAALAHRLRLDLRRDDEERTSELLRDGSVMAAVTTEPTAVAGCRATPLGIMRYRAVASPGYLARWLPDGVGEAALRAAPVVLYDRRDDLQHRWLRGHGVTAAPPAHHVPSTADHHRAVRLGMGWGMVPDLLGAEDRRAGRLVELVPDRVVDRVLHWQQWRLRSRALDELADAVVTAARTRLLPVPAGAG
ncbi:ArgP/LysG family DNA-binding transcriptional regulator [Jannaschia sp. R86511]|uniref:ArgP/LysG family DNA-binding transcriptional regulator n=1 Tax=Jannaschia sp. R86511 TaxID=3093853 RepID=UPI0036D3BDBF